MFIPDDFREERKDEIEQIIHNHPLATLIAHGSDGIIANHLPLLLNGEDKIIGHIARSNTLHELIQDGAEVLCIFQGSDAYISPNWYPTKAEHHKQVPTWNYQIVHCYGTIHFSNQENVKRFAVAKLTTKMEREKNGLEAWKMGDAPREYISRELEGIVALEVKITRIAAKSKLSQNKDLIDFKNVEGKLRQEGNTKMADAMITLKTN